MENFVPKINQTLFRDQVLELKEGSGFIAGQIHERFRNLPKKNFFDHFLAVCKEYRIGYYCFINSEVPTERYNVVVTFDGYDSQKMSYDDENLDIGVVLAKALSESVGIKIRNEMYLESLGDVLNKPE